jgi:hypothetical protein
MLAFKKKLTLHEHMKHVTQKAKRRWGQVNDIHKKGVDFGWGRVGASEANHTSLSKHHITETAARI